MTDSVKGRRVKTLTIVFGLIALALGFWGLFPGKGHLFGAPAGLGCAALTAAIAATYRERIETGPQSTGWTLIQSGSVVFATVAFTWPFAVLQYPDAATLKPWSVGMAASLYFTAAGIARLNHRSDHEFHSSFLDHTVIAGALTVIAWARQSQTFLLGRTEMPGTPYDTATQAIMFMSTLTLMSLSLFTLLRRHIKGSPARLIALGWISGVVSIAFTTFLVHHSRLDTAGPFAVPIMFGFFGTAWSALHPTSWAGAATVKRAAWRPLLPQALVVLALVVIVIEDATHETRSPVAALLVAIMALLVTFRGHVTHSQNESLLAALSQREEQLRHHAFYDDLTGLENRLRFNQKLDLLLQTPDRGPVAVAFVDLDGFKSINDARGHTAGDRLLIEVAQRLTASQPDAPSIARLSGDEFALVLPDTAKIEQAAQRIVQDLRTPFVIGGFTASITASVGIASAMPGEAITSDELVTRADLAMYSVKRRGRNNFRMHSAALAGGYLDDRMLAPALAEALDAGDLETHFQPVLTTQDAQLVAFEALSRWRHDGMQISPERFVGLAERVGLIDKLTDSVIQRSCEQLSQWNKQGHPGLQVGVNLGTYNLRDSMLIDRIVATMKKYDVQPGQICLEITETLPIDDLVLACDLLEAARNHGIQIALDDFGTGYNSISQLLRLPLSTVKIDRSMVKGIQSEPDRLRVVTGMVELAKHLGFDVIAEGVENQSQLMVLRDLEVDFVQGYLFGRPRPAETWAAVISKKHADMLTSATHQTILPRPRVGRGARSTE